MGDPIKGPRTTKPKVYKPRPLTAKQLQFIKLKAQGMSGQDAANIAYKPKNLNTARSIAHENLTKPDIRAILDATMVELGLTPKLALTPVAEALAHEDLEMRLKGTNTWLKLIPREQRAEITAPSIHFHNHQGDENKDYSL